MQLEDINLLLEAHLNPIKVDIKDLKEGQLQLIEIAKVQARHDEAINNIKKDVDECSGNVKDIKETKNNRLWEVIRLSIAGFVGAIIAKFI